MPGIFNSDHQDLADAMWADACRELAEDPTADDGQLASDEEAGRNPEQQ